MIAVDTNVLIYACDQADPRRQKLALDLITNTQDGVLLWQVAYAELVVTPVLWPDFRRRDLFAALIEYQQRERRFGGVSPREASDPSPALVQG